jgi:hypothetical protein
MEPQPDSSISLKLFLDVLDEIALRGRRIRQLRKEAEKSAESGQTLAETSSTAADDEPAKDTLKSDCTPG